MRQEKFCMGFREALEVGIDYRDYQKVARLPSNTKLTAIAGIWGDYRNIRVLFVDESGNKYLRNITTGGSGIYRITELKINAKEITIGQVFEVG